MLIKQIILSPWFTIALLSILSHLLIMVMERRATIRGGKLILTKLPKPHELTPFQACVKLKFIEEPPPPRDAKDIMRDAAIFCKNITPTEIVRWSYDLLGNLHRREVIANSEFSILSVSSDLPESCRREGLKKTTERLAKVHKDKSAIRLLKKQEWFHE